MNSEMFLSRNDSIGQMADEDEEAAAVFMGARKSFHDGRFIYLFLSNVCVVDDGFKGLIKDFMGLPIYDVDLVIPYKEKVDNSP